MEQCAVFLDGVKTIAIIFFEIDTEVTKKNVFEQGIQTVGMNPIKYFGLPMFQSLAKNTAINNTAEK